MDTTSIKALNTAQIKQTLHKTKKDGGLQYAWHRIKQEKALYFMFLPVLAYYIIFCYVPIGGVILAFKNYSAKAGILGSEWVGFSHFIKFFSSYNFTQILWNTIRISVTTLIFHFPAPIILAIMINEVRSTAFKRTVQTISYLPHFISLVVSMGLITNFLARDGLINSLTALFGAEAIAFMMEEDWFTTVYVASEIWQQIGWGSIIYLASISGISQELYEAADIDGAGRFRKMYHITLAGIMPTVMVLFIMQIGKIMSVGYEKIILLSNDLILPKSEVISSYVYKQGFGTYPDYGYSTAVNLFNTVINLIVLFTANFISRRLNDTSLW